MEVLPDFHEAEARLSAFLGERGLALPLLWVFSEDVLCGRRGCVVAAWRSGRNREVARERYERRRRAGEGAALVAGLRADEAICCWPEFAASQREADELMLPTCGLKLAVMDPVRRVSAIESRARWLLVRLTTSRCRFTLSALIPRRRESGA